MNTVGLFCFAFLKSNLCDATTNTTFRDPNRSEFSKNFLSGPGPVRVEISFFAGPGAV